MLPLSGALARAIEQRGSGLTILVLRLGALGDVLRTIPAVRLIRAALPEARMHWIVEAPWNQALEGHPDLDGVLLAPRRDWSAAALRPSRWPALTRSLLHFGRPLRALGAGLVVDFHGNLRSGLLAAWSGAPVRLGYSGHEQKEGNRLFTTHRVRSGERRTPRVERNLALVRALGLPDDPFPASALPLVAAGRADARALLREIPGGGDVAVVSPGASLAQAYKRPPPALLAAACVHLARRGVRSLVVWGPGEEAQARAVVELSGGQAVLSPPTGLACLAGLLDLARLFVGGDTGPMHLACAARCPVTAIYGPTDPLVNRPWGTEFRVVSPVGRRYTGIRRIDRAGGGFDGVTETQLTSALDEILDATAGPPAR